MPTSVTTKGQVTIPKAVRDQLGIGPGSRVAIEMAQDGRIILRKVEEAGAPAQPPSRFATLRGRATAGMTTEAIMALTRGDG